jgi:hypothetical protein
MSVFKSRLTAPHIMADPTARRIVQFIPLDRSAYALKHVNVETNRRGHVAQVEIVGFAAEADNWPTAELDWLGEHVVGPLAEHTPGTIDLDHHPQFFGDDAGFTLASASARQRMSASAWANFDGIAGHQHVPTNEHWDPGGVNIARIVSAATGGGFSIVDQATRDYFDEKFRLRKVADVRILRNVKKVLTKLGATKADIAELDKDIAELDADLPEGP